MTNPIEPVTPVSPRPVSSGCGAGLAPVLMGIYILVATVVAQFTGWTYEQTLYEGSFDVPDLRWAIALVYAAALLIPIWLAYAFTRAEAARSTYCAWMIAAGAALLAVPARLTGLVDGLAVAGLQILALAVTIIGLAIWLRRHKAQSVSGLGGIWMSLFWAATLAIPWVLWGALGSPVDTLLNLLVGLLIGALAARILTGILLEQRTGSSAINKPPTAALALFVALAILSTGIGMNGSQWMLILLLIPLAWGAVALARYGSRAGHPSWPGAALLLGLAAAWPHLFVDPDELALVVSSGPGELAGWAARMTQVSIVIAVIASFLLTLLVRRSTETRGQRAFTAVLALVALVAALGCYLLPGQPGFYGERLFVVLRDQSAVSDLAAIADYPLRRAEVYHRLVSHAESTQAGIRAELERFGVAYTPYYLVNGIEVDGGPLLRLWLQRRPEVDRVLDSPRMRPLPGMLPFARGEGVAPDAPQWNLTSIGAPRVWQELGVTGAGVVVGQSDSGVQGDHPELSGSYRGVVAGDDYNWFDPWYGSRSPQDFGGHGTHTLGSVLGKTVGVAPGATWIGCTNMGRNLGNPALYLDCMQFMLAPFPYGGDPFTDGDPALGAMVLNNSWGCPDREGCDNTALEPAVRALRSAGIFVVVSAGNSGYSGCGSVSDPPAIFADVYSVAALDSANNLAEFSSLGPVEVDGSLRVKPDIAAPGQGVLSAYLSSSYEIASGTSMAGPHVVGVVALIWSANPALIGDIDQTTDILNRTARPYVGDLPECVDASARPNTGVGYGMVDAYAAVQAALEAGQ